MKVAFFGSPAFAAEILADLLQRPMNPALRDGECTWDGFPPLPNSEVNYPALSGDWIKVVAIVTQPDRPIGRSGAPQPPPVKALAQKLMPLIPIYQPEKASDPDFLKALATHQADLCVVVAYGQILRETLLKMAPLGCINVHASLLPKYRGAAPIHRCLMAGEKESGVCIIQLVKELDAGDILKAVPVAIGPEMTCGELEAALCAAGKTALFDVIQELAQGRSQPQPQDHSQATYAAKISVEECSIDWRRPAPQVYNQIRGVTPRPGAWCTVSVRGESKRLKIRKVRLDSGTGIPGQILSYGPEGIVVACAVGAIRLLEVQLEGKRTMDAAEFTRGFPKEMFDFI